MYNTKRITNDLYYIGCSERRLSLFESVYPVPEGVSYNSYLLRDEKNVLFDTVDKSCEIEFLTNLEFRLNGQPLDYLIISHLEPDHSAVIKTVIEKYKEAKIVCNQKVQTMLGQFFHFSQNIEDRFLIVKEGDILSTGKHEFTFVMAPMVHWPEVMVTYDIKDKILFSADAFGSFGAISGNLFDNEVDFASKINEYRRYYTNIVGKYGPQVNILLNKARTLDIELICPLHGLLIKENIGLLVEKYSLWANYTPEVKSALIVYTSVYGNTKLAAEVLAYRLAKLGVGNIKMYDASFTDHSYILSDAFKYSHIVIATTTYNNNIFVNMEHFLDEMVRHNLQKRTFAIIENGSWAPNCMENIKSYLEKLKQSTILENSIAIKSSLKLEKLEELDIMAQEIAKSIEQ